MSRWCTRDCPFTEASHPTMTTDYFQRSWLHPTMPFFILTNDCLQAQFSFLLILSLWKSKQKVKPSFYNHPVSKTLFFHPKGGVVIPRRGTWGRTVAHIWKPHGPIPSYCLHLWYRWDLPLITNCSNTSNSHFWVIYLINFGPLNENHP